MIPSAKKIKYTTEREVPDSFIVGDCFECPFYRQEYIEWDDDGYSETTIISKCDLGFNVTECMLEIEDN